MLVKLTGDLLAERVYILSEINLIDTKIMKLKLLHIEIENLINSLSNELIKFIFNKYKSKQTNKEIAFLMKMSPSTVTRIKKQALQKIVNIS